MKPHDEDPEATAQALPKVLLHEHLDGGLRVSTLCELLQERGLLPPVEGETALARWFDDNAHAGSLEKYLEGFALTVAAMASPRAMRRVALEATEDAAADGAVLAEFRIAPLLFEAHGISGEATVEALLQGLADSPVLPLNQRSGLIVCAMRHLSPSETLRAARLAVRYQGEGVVGFDLAGAERGHPPGEHAQALALVRDVGDSALYQQAEVMAQWGRLDEAMQLLARARSVGDSGLTLIASDPMLAPLERNPRFQALVRDLGFT